MNKLSLAILIYLGTRSKLASTSDLLYSLGVEYVFIPGKPHCRGGDSLVRFDIKRALHTLESLGYAKFVGGHKWSLTEAGVEEVNRIVELPSTLKDGIINTKDWLKQ